MQKQKNKQKNKKKQKKEKMKPTTKKTAKIPKNSFSVISQSFPFLGGFSKFPFFYTLAQKPEPKKHYKNKGFRPFFFGKLLCVTKRPFLDQKPKIYKFQLSFFLPIFFSFNNKNTKICWNPNFYSVFANLKKRIFKKLT